MCSILFFQDNTIQLCHGASVTLDGKTSTLHGHHWNGCFLMLQCVCVGALHVQLFMHTC